MPEDKVRILRIVEYIGSRSVVERQIANSIHGTRKFGPSNEMTINVATIGEFPEILEKAGA